MKITVLIIVALASATGASVAAAWRSHVELSRLVDAIDEARAGNRECRDALTRAQARLEQYDELLGLVRDGRASKRGVGGGP